mmetsp:Transcript_20244/g.63521  ORF Transcript_20244/g.63521 Transcript_20244/m.63521 type:complete len:237 (+) Transcript_20244:2082-2792(+)
MEPQSSRHRGPAIIAGRLQAGASAGSRASMGAGSRPLRRTVWPRSSGYITVCRTACRMGSGWATLGLARCRCTDTPRPQASRRPSLRRRPPRLKGTHPTGTSPMGTPRHLHLRPKPRRHRWPTLSWAQPPTHRRCRPPTPDPSIAVLSTVLPTAHLLCWTVATPMPRRSLSSRRTMPALLPTPTCRPPRRWHLFKQPRRLPTVSRGGRAAWVTRRTARLGRVGRWARAARLTRRTI